MAEKMRADSISLHQSTWSVSSVKSEQAPECGCIKLGIWYENEVLCVRVVKAKSLAARAKSQLTWTNPYVKMYILPYKSQINKRKTTIKRRTNDPEYNEVLKIHLPYKYFANGMLWVTVWDSNKIGKNTFLGEVRLQLTKLDITASEDQWYDLSERDDSIVPSEETLSLGHINLELSFAASSFVNNESYGDISVHVKHASLPDAITHSQASVLAKVTLLHAWSVSTRSFKTKAVKNLLNPIWDEHFVFENLKWTRLRSELAIEVTVWNEFDNDKELIGRVLIGPASKPNQTNKWVNPTKAEASHWNNMHQYVGEWIQNTHILRLPTDDTYWPTSPEKSLDSKDSKICTDTQGKLTLVLNFLPNGHLNDEVEGRLMVNVMCAEGVLNVRHGFIHCFVRIALLPVEIQSEERVKVTNTIKNEECPIWVETFTFDNLKLKDLFQDYGLEVTVWGVTKTKSTAFLGGLRIVPAPAPNSKNIAKWNDSTPEESKHWDQMVSFLGQGIEYVHTLRNSMELFAVDSSGGEATALSQKFVQVPEAIEVVEENKPRTSMELLQEDISCETMDQYLEESSEETVHGSILQEFETPEEDDVSKTTDEIEYREKPQKEDIFAEVVEAEEFSKGKLTLLIKFEETKRDYNKVLGNINLIVKSAQGLKCKTKHGIYAEITLFPVDDLSDKKKTKTIKNSSNPVWNQEYKYTNLDLGELETIRALDITLFDHNKGARQLVGRVRLGPEQSRQSGCIPWLDCTRTEAYHWKLMLSSPGAWAEGIHYLRMF